MAITNCWLKSWVLGPKYGPLTEQEIYLLGQTEQRRLAEQVYQLTIVQISNNLGSLEIIGYVQQAKHLTNFFSAVEEKVADKDEDIVM